MDIVSAAAMLAAVNSASVHALKRAAFHALASAWLVTKAAFKSFNANRNLEIAATMAFYGFLALMPLLLLAVIFLGVFVRSSEAVSSALGHVVDDMFPALNQDLLADLEEISGNGFLKVIGVLLLMWAMTPLSGSIRSALALMFKFTGDRSFFKSNLIDLAAVLGFLLLFLSLVAIKIFLPSTDSAWLTLVIGSLLPFVLCTGFIGLFFRIFSPVRLSWQQWWLGAVCVTLLWGLMRNLFVVFVQYNPNYGYAFGSLKAIFLLIVWVYYSFAALLFGAEIMANTFRRDALLLHGLLDGKGPAANPDGILMKKFTRELAPGEVLFREEEEGREMFVVLSGGIRLTRHGCELATLDTGKYFGEMSLLRHAPRTATATSVGHTRLAVINQQNFDLLARENPVLVRNLLEELALRLADTDRKLEG